MTDLLSDDTDFEISKYYEARDMIDAGVNPAIEKNKKAVFNPETGMNDVLLPMSSGGYVKISEEVPEVMTEAPAQPTMPGASDAAPAQAAAEEAKRLQEIQGSYSLDDLRAAGYTDEQISAAGLDVQPTMPESRTEALSEQEVTDIIASGQPIITADPTLRQEGSRIITTFLYEAAVEGLRDELREQGVDPAQIDRMVAAQQGDLLRNAEVYSNALFGTGPTGMEVGAADFLTAGIMDIQEGRRLFNQQRPEQGGTLGGRAMGALIMAAGVAEATGVGYAFGKLLKRGAKALEPTLVRMGEEAQGRIDAEGDAPSATTPNQAGSAIKLYHGTDAAEFEQFDPSQARTAKHIYTSPIRDDAAAYGRNVLEFETDANILDLRADTRGVNEIKVLRQAYDEGGLDDYFESFDDFVDAFDSGDMYQRFGSQNAQNAVIDELFAASGADGLRIPDAGFGGSLSESVVFEDPSKLQKVTEQPAKPSVDELRRQANIARFGYDPNEVAERPSTGDEGFEEYLKTVNPSGKRIAAEDRPNLMMGDMYGMLPRGSEVINTQDGVTFYRSQDGDYYATAFNPDVGEEDVVGYITDRGDGTELAVVVEMQGQGIGGELQYLFRKENPNAPTGGLTEAGERSLQRTYERLREEGIVNGATSAPIGLIDEKPKGIKAFHGSGVDFDKFDLSFMGTGEGAQAYGKGLYFAEMEDVAQDYRQKLSGVLSNPLEEVLTPVDASPAAIAKADNDLKQAISFASVSFSPEGAARDFAAFTGREVTPELVEAFAQAMSNKGKMYEVRINADPNEMLDFDAPISEQPKKVQEVIAPFVEKRLDEIEAVGREEVKKAEKLGREFTPRTRSEILSTLKGGDILLLDKVETGQVSQALKDAGIPGIKYLDRQSRGKSFEIKLSVKGSPYATEPIFATTRAEANQIVNDYKDKGFDATITDVGSSNYVVLDDSLIDIVKKYGFVGVMVGAGVQSSLGVKESFEEA